MGGNATAVHTVASEPFNDSQFHPPSGRHKIVKVPQPDATWNGTPAQGDPGE